MKTSVSTYSFSKRINDGTLTQADCIKKAKEMGFDAVEICGIIAEEGYSDEEYAVYLKETAEKLDMPISNYTFDADLVRENDEGVKDEIEKVKIQLNLAKLVGAKSVRHDAMYNAGRYRTFQNALSPVAEAIREITEYAKALGIRTMVENHGYFCQDADRVERLAEKVNHENFSLLVDMGNFLCADEKPEISVGRVAHLAGYVHAKDFHVLDAYDQDPGEGFFKSRGGNYLRGAILGHGNVRIKQCLDILKNAGYDGYVSVEFEGMEDPLTALPICAKNLKKYLDI